MSGYIPQSLETGRTRNLLALTEADFDVQEIASRLAKINRFAGASKYPLSVATHSVVVSWLCPIPLAMTGLLHDITESFGIGDLISPVKALCPEYRELEHKIWAQLTVPFPALHQIEEIDVYDKRATAIEAYVHRGHWPEWAVHAGLADPLSDLEKDLAQRYYRREIPWERSAETWLDMYRNLEAV